jgi:hypothetical protein
MMMYWMPFQLSMALRMKLSRDIAKPALPGRWYRPAEG